MPRDAAQTRRRILDAAYRQFRRKGFTRVSMDEIAAAVRVTKRTLYYHFKSKDDLLAAVFEAQHELAMTAFRTFSDKLSGNAEQMIDVMFSDLAAWSSKPRWAGSGYTRIAMELADLPGHPARVLAKRHKAILEDHLAQLLAKGGIHAPAARSREISMLLEGAMATMLIHGDRSYAKAAADAAKQLLRSAAAPKKRK
jgi:AcrR family transcriptional regulator